jgi:hypothetical protein
VSKGALRCSLARSPCIVPLTLRSKNCIEWMCAMTPQSHGGRPLALEGSAARPSLRRPYHRRPLRGLSRLDSQLHDTATRPAGSAACCATQRPGQQARQPDAQHSDQAIRLDCLLHDTASRPAGSTACCATQRLASRLDSLLRYTETRTAGSTACYAIQRLGQQVSD